jgi:uncharacterized protein
MVGWILRLILLYIVIRALWRFVRGIAEGISTPRQTPPQSVGLVRDPVCGTFVVPSRALTSGAGNDTHFFCSERCREAWSRR